MEDYFKKTFTVSLNFVGVCECLSEFQINADKSCGSRSLLPPVAAPLPPNPESQPHTADVDSSHTAVAAGVVSVLIILALIVIAAFFINRHRLIPRLRAKLKNTPYEDIVISSSSRLP